MKIAEYQNLNLFLTMLFTFFKKHGIQSSISCVENYIDDYDGMLGRILECEFKDMSYYPGMYCVDFIPPGRLSEGEVYMYLFGNENTKGSSLLIDFGENDLVSFFNFTFDSEKHPPYLKDFADEKGRIKVHQEVRGCETEHLFNNDIMSFDEFTAYLNNNNKRKFLNMIDVD